ncbi:transposase [Oxalobacteraceae bacterium OTU3CINTB1]|nr:transposase [Oxalobacteraceae bacterium OTU3CINTB1]
MDDTDRAVWIQTLAEVCAKSNYMVHAFCQMTNHYHLLLETVDGNLSQGMRQLNGIYSQYFNRRHDLVGHVFQGRYKAILVQKESYLLELARYIVLNPVRAKLVADALDWPWSSFALTLGTASPPTWLDTDFTLKKFGDNPIDATKAYRQFVMDGAGVTSPLSRARSQLLLGDDDFVERIQEINPAKAMNDIARCQRGTQALPLHAYQHQYAERDEAIARAYATNAYSFKEIAHHFNISPTTVSRAVKSWNERRPDGNTAEVV